MQINFKAKKLKEANSYVDLLNSSKAKQKTELKKDTSILKKVFNFLFK